MLKDNCRLCLLIFACLQEKGYGLTFQLRDFTEGEIEDKIATIVGDDSFKWVMLKLSPKYYGKVIPYEVQTIHPFGALYLLCVMITCEITLLFMYTLRMNNQYI